MPNDPSPQRVLRTQTLPTMYSHVPGAVAATQFHTSDPRSVPRQVSMDTAVTMAPFNPGGTPPMYQVVPSYVVVSTPDTFRPSSLPAHMSPKLPRASPSQAKMPPFAEGSPAPTSDVGEALLGTSPADVRKTQKSKEVSRANPLARFSPQTNASNSLGAISVNRPPSPDTVAAPPSPTAALLARHAFGLDGVEEEASDVEDDITDGLAQLMPPSNCDDVREGEEF